MAVWRRENGDMVTDLARGIKGRQVCRYVLLCSATDGSLDLWCECWCPCNEYHAPDPFMYVCTGMCRHFLMRFDLVGGL